MKRMICLLLGVLLVLQISGCFADTDALVDELLADYAALLDAKEQLYTLQQEMVNALEAFVEENDYASLTRARIVCNSTVQQMKAFVLPEMRMSDDTIVALIQKGLELDGLEAEFVAMATDLNDFLNNAEAFETDLYEYVNQDNLLQIMRQRVASIKELLTYHISHDCFALNYLLSPLKDEPAVQRFRQELALRWPLTGSNKESWIESQTEIIEKAATNLQIISSLKNNDKLLMKEYHQATDRIRAALLSEDAQSVQKEMGIQKIEGQPTTVVNPTDWLNWEHAVIITKEQTSDKSGLPSLVMKQTKSVSLDAFMDYYKSLTSVYTENTPMEGSDETGWKAEFVINGAAFTLEWNPDETVSVSYDPHVLTMESEWYRKSMP